MCLGWNGYSLEVLDAVYSLLEWMNIDHQLNYGVLFYYTAVANKINKRTCIGNHEPKGKERVL